jgi:hypothetical protein
MCAHTFIDFFVVIPSVSRAFRLSDSTIYRGKKLHVLAPIYIPVLGPLGYRFPLKDLWFQTVSVPRSSYLIVPIFRQVIEEVMLRLKNEFLTANLDDHETTFQSEVSVPRDNSSPRLW